MNKATDGLRAGHQSAAACRMARVDFRHRRLLRVRVAARRVSKAPLTLMQIRGNFVVMPLTG